MKRLFAALASLGLLWCMLLPLSAWADNYPAWTYQQLNFRSFRTAAGLKNCGPTCDDSSAVARATGQHSDTTASLLTDRMQLAPWTGRSAGTVDSTLYVAFYYYPSGNTSLGESADSIAVDTQVSLDGSSWTTITPRQVFTAAPLSGAVIVEATTNNYFGYVLKQQVAGTGVSVALATSTAPTGLQTFGWRYLRFITSSDAVGEYQAAIGFWSQDR